MNSARYRSVNEVMRQTRDLLLDFDGPICSIFAGYPAPMVAEQLRDLIGKKGFELSPQMLAADDPLQVLRLTSCLGNQNITRQTADALREAELSAAASAEPTAGLEDVLLAAKQSRCRLTVVSNNSRAAVESYLHRHNLHMYFTAVVGRYDGMDPRHLKPDDYLINLALATTHTLPSKATLVGDSVSDIKAAQSAGVRTVGYANKPGKRKELIAAGADAAVDSMATIAAAIRTRVA